MRASDFNIPFFIDVGGKYIVYSYRAGIPAIRVIQPMVGATNEAPRKVVSR